VIDFVKENSIYIKNKICLTKNKIMKYRIRQNCRREPAKYVPIVTEVQVNEIPGNFPKTCARMIGKTYPAIRHIDNRGNTWYKILKDLVLGRPKEFSFVPSKDIDPEKVSFENRKYIALQAKYCE